MSPEVLFRNIRKALVTLDDSFIFSLHSFAQDRTLGTGMEKCCMGQWRPNLEPDMKSYLAWTPSPFVSNDWTITKETLLTCEQTWYSFFPLTGSHFLQPVCPPCTHPSVLLSVVVYLVQGGLGCLPRRAVLLQSYLLTIIDPEELGKKEREGGKCMWGGIGATDVTSPDQPGPLLVSQEGLQSVQPQRCYFGRQGLLKHPLTHPSAFFITSSLSV